MIKNVYSNSYLIKPICYEIICSQLFYCLFFILMLNSCVKEKDKVVNSEDTFTCALTYYGGSDFYYNFYYDDLNRLNYSEYYDNSTYWYIYATNYDVNGNVSRYEEYDYNGNFVYYEEYNRSNTQLDVRYYSADDYGAFSLTDKYLYSYNSDGSYSGHEYYYDDGNGFAQDNYNVFTWRNGNIVTKKYYGANARKSTNFILEPVPEEFKQNQSLKSTNGDLYLTITYEYDTHPNAFKSLGLWFLESTFSKNNFTKAYWEFSSGNTYEYIYEYTYNANNYPETRTTTMYYNGEYNSTSYNSFTYVCDL